MQTIEQIERSLARNVRLIDRKIMSPYAVAHGALTDFMLNDVATADAIRLCSGLPAGVTSEFRGIIAAVRQRDYLARPTFIGGSLTMPDDELQRRWRRIDEIISAWLEVETPK